MQRGKRRVKKRDLAANSERRVGASVREETNTKSFSLQFRNVCFVTWERQELCNQRNGMISDDDGIS
ncbi:hypothetical protein AAC387_Pa05g2959 [Persea americana]